MRWVKKEKQKYYPNDDDIRIVEKFLFFPKCIDDEYRWFEKIKIKQRYVALEFHDTMTFGCSDFYTTGGYWMDEEFVN